MNTIPEISLGTAVLVIFCLCAGYMLLRGILRTLVHVGCLLAGAWVGFRVWQMAPALAIGWLGKPSEWVSTGLPVVALLATVVILRKFIRFFLSPVPGHEEETGGSPLGLRLVLTLIPTTLIFLTAAIFLHHAGSVAEIRRSVAADDSVSGSSEWLARMNESLTRTIPPALLERLDPFASAPRIRLAKMIASPSGELEPVIDPETGKPYPRAIVVENPELKELAREGRFSTLLRHPMLTEAMKDSRVREALGF